MFEDEVYGGLKTRIKGDIKRIGDQDYLHVGPRPTTAVRKIAFVVGDGEITRGSTHGDGTGGHHGHRHGAGC